MTKPEIVFAIYKPKSGQEKTLERLIFQHVPTLKEYGLVTDRPPVVVQSQNGTYIEVFEWQSTEASKQAHEHPAIAKIWEAMEKAGSFEKLENLPEAKRSFPHFKPCSAQ